jgi:hypothetical protein
LSIRLFCPRPLTSQATHVRCLDYQRVPFEAIAEQIATAPLLWPQIAQEVGVVERDCEKIIQYAMPSVTFGSNFGPAM